MSITLRVFTLHVHSGLPKWPSFSFTAVSDVAQRSRRNSFFFFRPRSSMTRIMLEQCLRAIPVAKVGEGAFVGHDHLVDKYFDRASPPLTGSPDSLSK